MEKPKLTIKTTTGSGMIMMAISYDLAQIAVEAATAGFGGWLVNPIISFWALMHFWFWFKLKGVSFVNGKKALSFFGSYFGENIPWINDLPVLTTGVIITLAITYGEDIVGMISPEVAQALASLAQKKIWKKPIGNLSVPPPIPVPA